MDKSLLIQKQIKDNADDLQNYVRDLKLWEEEMKRKDRQLSKEPSNEALPPVRRPKLSNPLPDKDKKLDSKAKANKKIKSYDYSSWDKFDVDKACEEIDNDDNSNSEESSEDLPEQQEKYLKEKALYEKELGNKHVKASKWDDAISCYTRAIEAYPRDPVFFANRALCYLKKNNYELVESDCTASLKLDPTYVKAMLRRAAAREALGRLEDASFDLRNALKLEPNNNQALRDLDRLKKTKQTNPSAMIREIETKERKEALKQNTDVKEERKTAFPSKPVHKSKDLEESDSKMSLNEPDWPPCSNTVQPIVKPPHLRSKKSLKRIEIYDVGPNIPEHVCPAKRKGSKVPMTESMSAASVATSAKAEPVAPSSSAVKPRSILTMTSPSDDVPPPPSTSVQFHSVWNSMEGNPHLRYMYLKQIPGVNLPDIFKDALESRMFSSILETLASEFTTSDEPVLSYLRGLSNVRRFSTLTLFMSPRDKSNLVKLFDHCLKKAECPSDELHHLRVLYEM